MLKRVFPAQQITLTKYGCTCMKVGFTKRKKSRGEEVDMTSSLKITESRTSSRSSDQKNVFVMNNKISLIAFHQEMGFQTLGCKLGKVYQSTNNGRRQHTWQRRPSMMTPCQQSRISLVHEFLVRSSSCAEMCL